MFQGCALGWLQVLKVSLLNMHFEDIIKFFKSMKTFGDGEGNLNVARVGQLLMRQTERVSIPEQTMQYLANEEVQEHMWEVNGPHAVSDDSQGFGSNFNSSPWIRPGGLRHRIVCWLSFGSSRRRSSWG